MLFRGYVALRFPTRDINSPAAAGVNCQEEGFTFWVCFLGPARKFTSGEIDGADLCELMHIANSEFRVHVRHFF